MERKVQTEKPKPNADGLSRNEASESLNPCIGTLNLKPLIHKGFRIYRDTQGHTITVEKLRYKDIGIYFGCKAVAGKPDSQQPKSLKREWFVKYQYLIDGKYKRFKVKGGINRFKTIKERHDEAKLLRDALAEMLHNNYNPVANKLGEKIEAASDPSEFLRHMPIIEGLRWAKEKHDESTGPTTRNEYKNILEKVCEAIKAVNYENIIVEEFRKAHLRVVMDYIQNTQKISNNRYNTYVEAIKGIYKEFVRYDAFPYSPISNFEAKKELEPVSFELLTKDERIKIYNHLKIVSPDFLTFFLMIYHTALRPKELVSLQIFNYSQKDECFYIKPDETVTLRGQVHNKTKTNKTRYVAIPPEAMEILREMKLDQYPSEYFIFSKGFKPGVTNIQRKRATEVWNDEVIVNLKINKKMYSAKHLGLGDKIRGGVPIEAVKNQAGHTTQQMTEVYTDEHKKLLARELKQKSKGFLE